MTNFIQDFATRLLPISKQSPNGWTTFNCPACVHNGEPSPDTKKRMGFKTEPNGAIRYHCFRCGYVCGYNPGQSLSNKLRKLFSWFGASQHEILQANLECLRIRQEYVQGLKQETIEAVKTLETDLPRNSFDLTYWATQETPPEKFLSVINYVVSRSPKLLEWFGDFHWSPDMPEHIIIPLRYHNNIYGWTARLARPQKNKSEPKYYLNNTSKFLFNADLLDDESSKYLILVEGPLDAIAVNGIAILGNQITDIQLRFLQSTDKQIIVLPDKGQSGQGLIDAALENGWMVSFPDTEGYDIKDGFDMVNQFGRLFAVKMIIDNAVDNPLKINMLRKKYCG